MEINRVTHTASKLWSACGNGTQVAEALRLLVYLRGGAWFGSWRPAGEGAVLLGQLVQARLQALDAPVQLRHAPLRQLAHLGHLARNKAMCCLQTACAWPQDDRCTASSTLPGAAQPWPCLTCTWCSREGGVGSSGHNKQTILCGKWAGSCGCWAAMCNAKPAGHLTRQEAEQVDSAQALWWWSPGSLKHRGAAGARCRSAPGGD